MPFLFRSKSSSGITQTKTPFNDPPRNQFFDHTSYSDEYEEEEEEEEEEYEEEEEEEEEEDYEEEEEDGDCSSCENSPLTTDGGNWSRNYGDGNSSSSANNNNNNNSGGQQLPPLLEIIMTALRRSLVTCSVDRDDDDDVASIDISWPTEVNHVSHVTFDPFNGFLGLPIHLHHNIPRKPLSASVRVFGVSATSMQCSYDERGNCVPTILLTMQKHLYSQGGLQAEGIFRINAENSQEEFVRSQLNKGLVPNGIDVHCLAGLIKAWLRELPSGVLDTLTAEQVMQCNTEEECSKLVKLLPSMEAALLDWTINLMADVVQHQSYNKMNARNIAMVFAPNMTQMADPLTALMHAVHVINFLKTLILKTIRQREEELVSSAKATLSRPPSSLCIGDSPTPTADPCQRGGPISSANSASICLDSSSPLQRNFGKQETQPSSKQSEISRDSRNNGDWLRWRKGVRKVYRHSVFRLTKQISLKKTRSFGFMSGNGRGEAWV